MKFLRVHFMLSLMGLIQMVEGAILFLSFGCIQSRLSVRIAIAQLRKSSRGDMNSLVDQMTKIVENKHPVEGQPAGKMKWPTRSPAQRKEAIKRAERVTKAL